MIDLLLQEFDYSYELIRKTFSIEFPKPKLFYGDEEVLKHIKINSIKDLAYFQNLAGLEVDGDIYLPDSHSDNPRSERIFTLLHELGHSFADYSNPDFNEKNIDKLIVEEPARGYVYCVFNEGLANHIAITSSLGSGDENLAEAAARTDHKLKNEFTGWISSEEFKLLACYCVFDGDVSRYIESLQDPEFKVDWRKTMASYFSSVPEAMIQYKYLLGHNYFSHLSHLNGEKYLKKTLKKVVMDPPKTIEELLSIS